MPVPLIPIIAGVAARAVAGTAGRAVAGHAVKTAAKKLPSHTGRTVSGKTLRAAKPRKQWNWKEMASNFAEESGERS